VVLEIAAAQYQPENRKDRYRYTIESYDENESYSDPDNDGDKDSDHGNEKVNVVSKLVDEDYTIDDISALADTIKSKGSPMQLLTWYSEVWRALGDSKNDIAAKNTFMPGLQNTDPFTQNSSKTSWPYFHGLYENESNRCRGSLISYAIVKNDMSMLQSLTNVRNDLARHKADEDSLKMFICPLSDYDFAVCLGRTETIGHMIKGTGVSILLEKLVDASGVIVQEKPKYYQGLSVHGKKRKDWADRGRVIRRAPAEGGHPLLLCVTFEGNLESTEYFTGDAPLRRYEEFAAAHGDDKRIQILSQAEGGIAKLCQRG
jgi:hypothetical protein